LLLAAFAAFAAPVQAKAPSLAAIDAAARAGGTNKALARKIGERLFQTEWPVQVLNVYVDSIPGHDVAGLHLSGKKFHRALTRPQFYAEIVGLAQQTLGAAPVEEVDIYTTVPIVVGRDLIVAGDLARPTSRNVFTVTVRRGESPKGLAQRLQSKTGVFVDEDWARAALK
jgi:hypothetical protein